ncbi:MAG: DUF4286 family protein [Woeseiaceae bacterium]
MPDSSGPIYEVRLFVDPDAVAECDAWLEDHVRKSLRDESVSDCYVFAVSSDDDGRAGRVCQYILTDDDALDESLGTLSAQIEAELKSRFADTVEYKDRVLREDDSPDIPLAESRNCLNCGTNLRGQYCGHCGQRSRGRLISLWELITDAFGDLFEVDSRLWQTLVPLVIRPGRLTHDYLQGRRARFMPPFRMYLVLSLVFFIVAFFNPREELGILFEPPAAEEVASIAEEEEEEEEEDENDVDGLLIGIDENGEKLTSNGDCDVDDSDVEGIPDFLAKRLTPERLKHVCEQIHEDDGKSVVEKVVNNVPTALIVLLPLMAFVLKVLYPLSRRYYVEHLLFFVHLHAFLFLLITLQILFVRLAAMLSFPELLSTLTIVATSVYAPVYLFVAMRRVYGQGRFVTFLKYIVLTLAYIMGFSTIIALTFALAAFSI